MPSCSRCGTALKPDAAFCGQCGHQASLQGSPPPPTPPVVPPIHASHVPQSRGFVLVGIISGVAAALSQEWVAHNVMGVKTMTGMVRLLPFVVSMISSFLASRPSMKRSV